MRKLLCFLLIPFCMSCLWDSDTLKEEGKGRMDAVKVIVGWFDRYPPDYYQARLDRVLMELETNPQKYALYDDAGVALDRLHRSDEAIVMMERKKAAMTVGQKGETATQDILWEHQYRYLANLGTFYVHRWIGKEREVRNADLSDLAKAEELIAAALEHNPEAHFGREKYQLLAIQWLQKSPSENQYDIGGPLGISNESTESEEALNGFLGMIKLGSAWESTDFFNTVGELLSREKRRVLATAALLRVKELEEAGRGSLHPYPNSFAVYIGGATPERKEDVESWFHKARQAADDRQESRWAYLLKGMAAGRHPDTDSDFWNDWKEPEFPALPGLTARDFLSPMGIAIVSIIFFTLLWIISLIRRRRKIRHLESIPVVGVHS